MSHHEPARGSEGHHDERPRRQKGSSYYATVFEGLAAAGNARRWFALPDARRKAADTLLGQLVKAGRREQHRHETARATTYAEVTRNTI